jgi:hypothetical protein
MFKILNLEKQKMFITFSAIGLSNKQTYQKGFYTLQETFTFSYENNYSKIESCKITLETKSLTNKTQNKSSEVCKKITNIYINNIKIKDIKKLEFNVYEMLVINFFEKRNNHYIPQSLIKNWLVDSESLYYSKHSSKKENKYHFENRTKSTIFSEHDGYIFILNNEIVSIEDGLINYIENAHIFPFIEYIKNTPKSFTFDDLFFKQNSNIIENLAIIFYYNVIINSKHLIKDIFEFMEQEIEYIDSYEKITQYYAEKSLKMLMNDYPDPNFWGICKLESSTFLLTNQWMNNFNRRCEEKDIKENSFLIIPIIPDAALIFANNIDIFKSIFHDLEFNIIDHHKANIQLLLNRNNEEGGILSADKRNCDIIRYYENSTTPNECYPFLTNRELSFINEKETASNIFNNIENNWTRKVGFIKYMTSEI